MTFVEINSFQQLQDNLNKLTFFIHFDKIKRFYININVSQKKDYKIIIYYFKKDMKRRNHPLIKNNVLFIVFLNKLLSKAKIKYWFTKFKIIVFVWTMRKFRLIIFNSNHSIIIYTSYNASSNIIFQIKFIFNNIDRFNIRFIQTFIYFFQFKLKIHHRIDCFNLVSDALNRLFIKNMRVNLLNDLNVNNYFIKNIIDMIYIFNQTIMTINDEFRTKIIKNY